MLPRLIIIPEYSNSQIHPWDIRLEKHKTGEKPQTVRWEGNIQLIGYIDVIFLISYQGTARFQDGIVIYSESLAYIVIDVVALTLFLVPIRG